VPCCEAWIRYIMNKFILALIIIYGLLMTSLSSCLFLKLMRYEYQLDKCERCIHSQGLIDDIIGLGGSIPCVNQIEGDN